MLPAAAVKFTVFVETGTTTEAGVLKSAVLFVIATVVPPAGAACEMVMLHGVVPVDARVAAVHCREVMVAAGPASDTVAD